MKEILFRAKTKNYDRCIKKGTWVYGDYVNLKDGTSILPHIYGYGEVVPETVGQYVGIEYKNGNKLFEGDIVKFITEDHCEVISIVHYDVDLLSFMFECEFSTYTLCDVLHLYDYGECEKFEIIGNIYDNPDLIHWDFEHILNIKAERENK